MAEVSVTGGRFRRIAETGRRPVMLEIDGVGVATLEGDTVLVAVLTTGRTVRVSEFGDGDRAGFCMMGACQDCWMWTAEGSRLRACTTPATDGMRLSTRPVGKALWPRPA